MRDIQNSFSPGRVIEDSQHRHDSIGSPVSSTNVRVRSAYVVNGQSDSAGVFGDDGTLLQSVVDAVNAVVFHSQKKARGQLYSHFKCMYYEKVNNFQISCGH
jgi:hypothetical protein